MGIKLADAFVFFKADSSELDKAQQSSESSTRGWASRVGGVIQNAFGYALGTVAVGAVKQVGEALQDWVVDAAAAEGIEKTFFGMADAAKLAELRMGSLGTVLDVDLMKNYNSAAISVSQSFADDLPEAMQYFGKISAATGEDIGYLMSSYTTGISRLSPMILDNLKIQVNQTEANRVYAESIGKTVDQLTKEEQQMALNQQVLTLLEEKTRDMPEASEGAAVKMAQLKTTLGNMATEIGGALLPALVGILTPLGELAQQYGPQVVAWAEKAGVWLAENLPLAIATLQEIWNTVFPAIQGVVQEWWPVIAEVFALVAGWLQNDGPAAMTALQTAWTTIVGAISGFISERLGVMKAWWDEHGASIKVIIDAAMQFIDGIIKMVMGGIQAFWTNWGDEIKAITSNAWESLKAIVDAGMKIIGEIIDAIAALIKGDWDEFGNSLRTIWETLWETIKTVVGNGIDSVMQFIHGLIDDVKGAFDIDWGELGRKIIDGIKNGISNGIGAIRDAAKNAAQAALDAAKDFLGIKSPSRAFELLGAMSVEGFVKPFEDMDAQPIEGALLRAVAPVVDGLRGTMYDQRRYEKHLHVTTVSNAESLVGDFALLGVMA